MTMLSRSRTSPPASTPPELRRSRPVSLRPRAPESEALIVTYAAHGCVIGHVRNMTFCAWNSPPIAEQVESFMGLAEHLSRTYTLNSNVTLVMPDADLPDAKARAALERLTSEYARAIHSVALVIDGSGFRASLIRSFLTGLHLLQGNHYRCKTFAKPAEANPWLLPAHNADTGIVLSEREMQVACDAVLARLSAT